jgi:hypothetical protein
VLGCSEGDIVCVGSALRKTIGTPEGLIDGSNEVGLCGFHDGVDVGSLDGSRDVKLPGTEEGSTD